MPLLEFVQELAQQLPGAVPCDSFERWLITYLIGALSGVGGIRALQSRSSNGGGG